MSDAGGSDDVSGWRRYHDAMVLAGEKIGQSRGKRTGEMSRGWCLGSTSFRAGMKQRMLQKGLSLEMERLSGLEIDEARKEREDAWEMRLEVLAAKAGIGLDKLPAKKSDSTKTLLAAAMKQSSSASNGWLAKRLGMGKAASASQFVRRRMSSKEDAKEVRAILSIVKLRRHYVPLVA